jgi:formylglycine-generating enzyme required for sulfatase activity
MPMHTFIQFQLLLFTVLYGGSASAAPSQQTAVGNRALVIGNDLYPSSMLSNAVNDAVDVGRVLEQMGFGVTVITNATTAGLETAVSSFITTLVPGDRVIIFYAGHGVQQGVENYMIPIDFGPTTAGQISMQAYPLSRLQHLVAHAAPSLQIMIFDACRDNPFQSQFSLRRGWNMVENVTANSYIAYSTAPGGLAQDDSGRGRNGLFTSYLLDPLKRSGLTVDQIFNGVRNEVYSASGSQQLPWTTSSLLGDTYLVDKRQFARSSDTPISVPINMRQTTSARPEERGRPIPGCVQSSDQDAEPKVPTVKVLQAAISEAKMISVLRHDVSKSAAVVTEQSSPAFISTTSRSCRGIEYVLIPAGTFRAFCAEGDDCEVTDRVVAIDHPFWMGKTEVTVKEYRDAMLERGLRIPEFPFFNDRWHLANHPVVNVSLEEAQRFCSLAGGRLPLNDEWEYAATAVKRAGRTLLREVANYGSELCCGGFVSGRDKWEYTAPVGSFQPNRFGLHDILGNVWEWVLPDRSLSTSGQAFIRGGSWSDSSWYLRSTYRRPVEAKGSFSNVGFRCVLVDGAR